MSSHYFVKDGQEYSLLILGIPQNPYWEEYLGWQPNVYAVEKVLDLLSKENIPIDFLFTEKDLENFEFVLI